MRRKTSVANENDTLDLPPELVEAKRKLLEAETRKMLAEAAELELSLKQAKAYAAVQAQKLALDKHDLELAAAGDGRHLRYNFVGGVDARSSEKCIDMLRRWGRSHPKADIEIVFNSPGGSVISGMALFDEITALVDAGHKVTTVARGMAASMGGILLQAGSHRVMGREAYVLIHEISSGAGGKLSEIEDEVAFLKKMSERVINIFVKRAAGKGNGKLTAAFIRRKWDKTDWWLSSDDCMELGLVDEVR
jgi:ATP-dependent Clp endopeptidase proteolytic subunit ClpP